MQLKLCAHHLCETNITIDDEHTCSFYAIFPRGIADKMIKKSK